MKASFNKRSCRRISLAASALVGALTLVTGPAFATSYTAHTGLTPYQIVASTSGPSMCLKFQNAGGMPALLAPCGDDDAQKFYVLAGSTGTHDFIPQKQNPGVDITIEEERDIRIVRALKPGTSGAMKFLTYARPNTGGVGYVATDAQNNIVWRTQGAQAWDSDARMEGSSVDVPNVRAMRFGKDARWAYKEVMPNTASPCTVGSFGSDPYYGVVKECQVWAGSPEDTPYKIIISIKSGTRQGACLVASGSSPEIGSCSDASARWTLRPTNYPQ